MTSSRLDAIAARYKHFLGRDLAAALLAILGTVLAVLLSVQLLRAPIFTASAAGSARPAAAHLAHTPAQPASARGDLYVAKE